MLNGLLQTSLAYWSGLPFPPPGDLPDPGIEPAVSYGFFYCSATWEASKEPETVQLGGVPLPIPVFMATVTANTP